MPSANQPPSQSSALLSPGRIVAAALLYLGLAVIPPSPFERPLALMRLVSAPAPTHVALPIDRVAVHDSWGNPRAGGRHHEGIDLFAPRGTRVVASTEGLVWRIGTDPLGGLVVWVLGPGGQMHYYAHLDSYGPYRAGDRVGVGDTLGFVGTTGNARGGPPHLHYGVYAGGGAINPYPLLAPPRTSGRDTPGRAPKGPASPASSG